jgi:hypothetical protein
VSEQAEDALLRLGRVAGDDLILLQPLGEAHFDPISATVEFGGVLLSGFFSGMAGGLIAGAEDAGARTATWLRDRLRRVFASGDGPDAEEVAAGAEAAAEALDAADWLDAAARARQQLVEALVANGLPRERAEALSGEVQREALTLLGAERAA